MRLGAAGAWPPSYEEDALSTSTYDPRVPVSPTVDTITAAGSGPHIHRRISWAAIFGGVILVLAVQLLLSLLGAGFGLGTINTSAGSTPTATTLGIGAGIWWVITSCLALGEEDLLPHGWRELKFVSMECYTAW